MAKNFEIIFNSDAPVTMADGSIKQWSIDEAISIANNHNCEWVCAPHVPDEMSKFNHWHFGLHTSSDNTYETISKWFGLPVNSIQKIKGQFYSTYLLYIIHFEKEGKTPVPFDKVKSNFALDYEKLISNIKVKKQDDEILNKLARGEITEYDLYANQPEEWCRKNLKRINDALVVRSKKFVISKKNREMEVIYIYGPARCGKSTLAKKLCADNNQSFYVSSSGKNPFDDYMGQQAIILDDVRPSDFKFSELLKVLDNHMSSKVSARYHNVDLNCRVMYITTILPLEDFYKAVQLSDGEAVEQLRGRIGTLIKLDKEHMTISVLTDNNHDYLPIMENVPNPLLTDEDIKKMTTKKRIESAKSMLKGIADFSNFAMEQLDKLDEDKPIDGQLGFIKTDIPF